MKLLVSMGLADRSLKSHITPLRMLDGIHKIIIVRDTRGPEMPGVVYHTPPPWSAGRPLLKTLIKFFLLLYLALRERPGVVHGYLLVPNGLMAFVVGKLTGRRTGVSLLAGPVELFMLSFLAAGSPMGRYAYNRPPPKIEGINRVLAFIIRRFDFITVTGNYTRNFLIRNQVPVEKISVIYHAIDPVDCPEDTPKIYDVIYVGRLAKVKHLETLIRAVEIGKTHDPPVRAGIIGAGPEMAGLKALSEELDTSHLIDFLGYTPDVYFWYNRARISVVSSEREGFPYSVIESLSCGCPVIASNCGDITDILIHGVNGMIVDDYSDHPAFAGEIMKILDQPSRLLELRRNTVKSVEKVNREAVSRVWAGIMEGLQR